MHSNRIQHKNTLKSPEIWTFFGFICLVVFSYALQLFNPSYKTYLVLSLDDYFFQIQLFTYAFIHKNLLHLLSNLVLFIILYKFMIQYFNWKFTWTIFFIGILLGGLGFLLIPNSNTSAYIMGISAGNLGWFLTLWYHHSKGQLKLAQITIQFRLLIIIILIFHLTSFLVDKSNSWQAHIGSVFVLPLFIINSLIRKHK